MTTGYGYKRIGNGYNCKVLHWESLGSDLYRCHCYPLLTSATRLVSGGGESYTQYKSWYSSGHVVAFPYQYNPFGAFGNNPNGCTYGSLQTKASRGDTFILLDHSTASNLPFWIERAEPGAGIDFSGYTSDRWRVNDVIGYDQTFRFDEHLQADGTWPTITIDSIETQYTGSVAGEWTTHTGIVQYVLNRDRPYTPPADPIFDLQAYCDLASGFVSDAWQGLSSIYKSGDGHTAFVSSEPHGLVTGDEIIVRNSPNDGESDGQHVVAVFDSTTFLSVHRTLSDYGSGVTGSFLKMTPENVIQMGSRAIVLNQAFYGHLAYKLDAVLIDANHARVQYKVNGQSQTPKEITVHNPYVDLSVPMAEVASMTVTRQDRKTGDVITMTNAGSSINDYDPFINEGINGYKVNSPSGRLYFSPLLIGDAIQIEYKTTTPVGFADYGEPCMWFKPYQVGLGSNRSEANHFRQFKHADILDIRDCAGILSRLGDLSGFQFAIGTNGVMRA